jgi:membrane fusion protein, multidrug efflux system
MRYSAEYALNAAGAFALVLATTVFTGCGKENANVVNVKKPPLVSVISVQKADPAQKIVLSGQIKARHETALGFRVAGKIATRNIDAGQTVKAGEVLYTLDDTDYELKVNAMRAAENAAKAVLDNARDELGRHQRMLDKQFISQAQYDRVKSGFDQAQAGYDAAVAARKNAENDASYTKLVGDQPAIVSEVLADVGQVVSAGMPVMMLSDTSDVEAEAYIPEKYASQIKIGDASIIRVSSAGSDSYEGSIREIAGMADPRTRTYRARITFRKTPQNLRLGMSANVVISVPLRNHGVIIPPEAVCDGDKPHIWIVGSDGTATKRDIQIEGIQDGSFIVSGVSEGENVVIDGARFIYAAEKVRISSDSSK